MRKLVTRQCVLGAVLCAITFATPVLAQDAEADAARQKAADLQRVQAEERNLQEELRRRTPLQVQLVISRYQGDKRISSMPYVLAVNAVAPRMNLNQGERGRLRMGARVPISAMPGAIGPVAYEDIGTSIDCVAREVGDGSFELSISLEDKSVYPPDQGTTASATGAAGPAAPVFRTFQTGNVLMLRDGQSRQFTAATDRINGEVIRVEVTLTVVK